MILIIFLLYLTFLFWIFDYCNIELNSKNIQKNNYSLTILIHNIKDIDFLLKTLDSIQCNLSYEKVKLILFISFLSFCAFPIIIYNNFSNYLFVASLVVLKILIEFLLLYCGAKKFKIKFKLHEFLWWELLHIPYIAFIGILSYFDKFFSWRGRRLN